MVSSRMNEAQDDEQAPEVGHGRLAGLAAHTGDYIAVHRRGQTAFWGLLRGGKKKEPQMNADER